MAVVGGSGLDKVSELWIDIDGPRSFLIYFFEKRELEKKCSMFGNDRKVLVVV